MVDSTNQNNFIDNQNFKIDITKIYSEFIAAIDKIRSHVSTANNSGQLKNLINSINQTVAPLNDPDYFKSYLLIDPNNVQESRCHAFYRLIGLPVAEPGGTFYTPGINRQTDTTTVVNKRRIIAAKIPQAVYSLMDARETNVFNFLNIFSVADINASVLALSIVKSNEKRRKFTAPLDNSQGAFDSNVKDQSYTFADSRNVSDTADLLDYTDANGNKPGTTSISAIGFLRSRSHIIKPFIVDPRVEATVNPPYSGTHGPNDQTTTCRIMAAPFAQDKSQLLYTDNVYATRPILETICRARLANSQPQASLTQRFQDLISYVKNNDLSKDEDLLDKIFQNPTMTTEEQVLLKYINIMRSMVDLYYKSVVTISETEGQYHWVPIPNVQGPEFGVTTQGIVINDPLNQPADSDILNATAKYEIDQINDQSTQTTSPDLGNFVDFERIQPLPDDQTTSGLGNRTKENLDKQTTTRSNITGSAEEALKNLEIIMGEFSGLGLADIIAIYTALWTVDLDTLVSMLDDESFSRMYKFFPQLRNTNVEARNSQGSPLVDIITVLNQFEDKIKEIYSIMDKLLLDRLNNNST